MQLLFSLHKIQLDAARPIQTAEQVFNISLNYLCIMPSLKSQDNTNIQDYYLIVPLKLGYKDW